MHNSLSPVVILTTKSILLNPMSFDSMVVLKEDKIMKFISHLRPNISVFPTMLEKKHPFKLLTLPIYTESICECNVIREKIWKKRRK